MFLGRTRSLPERHCLYRDNAIAMGWCGVVRVVGMSLSSISLMRRRELVSHWRWFCFVGLEMDWRWKDGGAIGFRR